MGLERGVKPSRDAAKLPVQRLVAMHESKAHASSSARIVVLGCPNVTEQPKARV